MPDLDIDHLFGNVNKLVFALFLVVLFYTLSLFIAPLTLEPGTVSGLDGNANMVDYHDKWDDLPVYHQGIYLFSDLNCHQKHTRSYQVNENQMPVCARDVGIFIGFSVGFFLMSFMRGSRDFKDILLNLVNLDQNMSSTRKSVVLFIIGSVLTLPLVLDGSIQLVTDYESFNAFRTFTGLLFGFAFSAFISSLILSTSSIGHYEKS